MQEGSLCVSESKIPTVDSLEAASALFSASLGTLEMTEVGTELASVSSF